MANVTRKGRVVQIALDERPCNYNFPLLMPKGDIELIVPPISLLGKKKKAAEFEPLKEWILNAVKDADCIILSTDMLLYGGIVPSRLHNLDIDEIKRRADLIDEIKRINKKIEIYAFGLIMRCPWYSLSDEEPDYYDYCGSEIHHLGRCRHLEQLGLLSNEDRLVMERALKTIKPCDLEDYTKRREKNITALMYILSKVKDGIIDYFIMPQDDAAVYGWTAMDQIKVRKYITENTLHLKASVYPDADAVGLTLLSRFVCKALNKKPKIYVHYASSQGASVIPCLEDRIIDETLKYHIYAAGGLRVYSFLEADMVLFVNIGSRMEDIKEYEKPFIFDINRNLCEFVEFMKYAIKENKAVAIADVGVLNGGDLELAKLLESEDLIFNINAYAGWNTSSNTVGTAVCQGILSMYNPDKQTNCEFLTHRYLEDIAYCQYIRQKVRDEVLPKMGLNYFDSGEVDGEVARVVEKEVLALIKKELPKVYEKIDKIKITMPWKRMFEIDLRVWCKRF